MVVDFDPDSDPDSGADSDDDRSETDGTGDADRSLRLEYRRFSLELSTPLETAHGTIASRAGYLVRISDGEVAGVGEATPLAGWTESSETCADALDRARLAVAETTGQADAWNAALEATGETTAARHAVSLALLDYGGNRSASPLYRLLGSEDRVARVPVNATVGDGSPAATAVAARSAVEDGFECVKVKAGVGDLGTDLERFRAVREAVGPDVSLRVDANGAWTYEEAERALESLVELDASLLEQPLPAGALEGHAELVGRGVAIALDEGVLDHGIDAIADAGAADAVVLKPMAIGGVDLVVELATWARERDLEPIVTTTVDGVVARTGAVHAAAAIPSVSACGLATASLLADDLGRDPVPIEKGRAVVPQAKGLGVSGVWTE